MLAPGGTLRVSTPDLAKYALSYARVAEAAAEGGDSGDGGDGDDGFLRDHARRFAPMCCEWELDDGAFGGGYSAASALNNIMRNYGHERGWIWDAPSLSAACRAAGIPADAIHVDRYRSSELPAALATLDLPYRRDESLYLRIVKPAVVEGVGAV